MERQPSLPQPVLYEPDGVPLVSVAEGASSSASPHQLLVVPVWETSLKEEGALLTAHAHLGQLNAASLGALGSAIKLHGFTGKKVRWSWPGAGVHHNDGIG